MNLETLAREWHSDATLPEPLRQRLRKKDPKRPVRPARVSLRVALVGGSLAFFSLLTMAWYKSHYAVPVPLEKRKRVVPQPNGYETATKACEQKSVALLRTAFGQEWLASDRPGRHDELMLFERETKRLAEVLAPAAWKQGKHAEAAQYQADAIALGMRMQRGGALLTGLFGRLSEKRGEQGLWDQLDQLDAPTLRATLARLLDLEAKRTSYADILNEERYVILQGMHESFAKGPVEMGKQIDLLEDLRNPSTIPKATIPGRMWEKVKVVYLGPQSPMAGMDQWLEAIAQASNQPWQAKRALSLPDDPYCRLYGRSYLRHEFEWVVTAASRQLLITSVALRLYRLEKGSTAPSLEALVAAEYLPTVPLDPFSPTRAPLHYQEGRLWSVGPDGVDNGGVSAHVMHNREKRTLLLWGNQTGDLVAGVTKL